MSLIQLFNRDCLEVMDELIEKGVKVDAIITDPPYGTTACKWDSVIPFDEMWERVNKLVKDHGAIVLFGAQPFTSSLVNSNLKGYKHHWIWKKNRGTGFQVAKYRPMMETEDIITFTKKGERVNYYPQMTKRDKPLVSKIKAGSNTKSKSNPLHLKNPVDIVFTYHHKYPTNVIECEKVSKTVHPTQKPTDLLEYLIKTYTLEGETVLDFTMGSGSTGVACQNTGRHFIGIELDENYFNIAKERMNQ